MLCLYVSFNINPCVRKRKKLSEKLYTILVYWGGNKQLHLYHLNYITHLSIKFLILEEVEIVFKLSFFAPSIVLPRAKFINIKDFYSFYVNLLKSVKSLDC